DGDNAGRRTPASRSSRGPQPGAERKGREQGTPVAERPRESNRKPRPSKPRDERPAGAPGDKPAARKPQVKRRPKPAGDGMRPGFRR
ncbi:23S rRNA pseudouridylate synthase B, partial [Pseudomonas aeruginosa]